MLLEDFKIGRRLVEEMAQVKPYQVMRNISCPILILHGDKDTYVPYEISKKYARSSRLNRFIRISGSEHGFGKLKDRKVVINETVNWIQKFTQGLNELN